VTAPSSVTLVLLFLVGATAAAAAPTVAPAAAGPTFDVGGNVSLNPDGDLSVRVDLTNRGGAATGPVKVSGELAGHYEEATVEPGVAPGQKASVGLVFPPEVPRPGVYPVVLLLDYAPRLDGGAAAVPLSQRAFLLLTLGATAAEPVRLSMPEVTLRDRSALPVGLESADGRAHRVRLRVLTPRGLNPERIADEVQVPATGVVTVSVPLLRGAAPRPSRQGILVVAETLDGDTAQASASTTVVAVEAAPPDLMPRWRDPFLVAAALLLAAAAVLEWRHLREVRRSAQPAA
jgi:hypothetical protein